MSSIQGNVRQTPLLWKLVNVKDHIWPKPSFPILSSISALSVTVGYLAFRSWLFEGRQDLSPQKILTYDNFVLHLSGMPKLMTALYIQAKYVQLLLWPDEASSDYSLGVVDPIFTWSDLNMILFYGVAMGLILAIGSALQTLMQRGNTALVQAIGWTFAPLVPASHIVTIGTPMAERLLFTPSIGVTILICYLFAVAEEPGARFASGRQRMPIQIIILIAMVAASTARFSIMTCQRVPEWGDSKAAFEADIKKFPKSVKLSSRIPSVALFVYILLYLYSWPSSPIVRQRKLINIIALCSRSSSPNVSREHVDKK